MLYGERIYVGYRWYDATDRDVCFPFGHGLSYTTFEYSDPVVTVPDPTRGDGCRRGDRHELRTQSRVRRGAGLRRRRRRERGPTPRELKAFRKVRLEPGASVRVRLDLDERAFAFWGTDGWVVEPGLFRIEVGASSRDIRSVTIVDLDVPAPVRVLGADSTVAEWDAHPTGRAVLRAYLEGATARLQRRGRAEPGGRSPAAHPAAVPARPRSRRQLRRMLAQVELGHTQIKGAMTDRHHLRPRPLNLADVLEAMADAVPDRVAIVTIDRDYTYAEIDERSTRLANHLVSLGVGPGDHVAVHSANRIEWVDAFYGCLKARAVPININYKYLHDELAYLYDNADCVAAIVAPEHVDAVAGARPAARSST